MPISYRLLNYNKYNRLSGKNYVVKKGKVVDYEIVYNDDYLQQQLDYGKKYGTL